MKGLNRFLLPTLALLFCVQFVACGGSGSNNGGLGNTTPTLQSVQVTPATQNLYSGQTQQYKATGNYSDSTTKDLTSSANWLSSDATVATISVGGLATATSKVGSTTITASSGGVTGTATLNIQAPPLVSISVTPATASVAPNATQQFKATGTYQDKSTKDITTSVTWNATSGASISNTGLATGVSPGTSTITASLSSITGTATLTITNPIVSIAVTPANQTIAPGTQFPFKAAAKYFDNSTVDITSTVSWTSSNTAAATISDQIPTKGLATAVAPGSTTITASSGSISGTANLTVSAAKLVSIAISPTTATLPLFKFQNFTALGKFDDGSTQDITTAPGIAWSSSAPTIVAITSTSGVAQGLAPGNSSVRATKSSITSNPAAVTVSAANLVAITIVPTASTIAKNTSLQFTAKGQFNDGTVRDITYLAAWSSDNTAAVSIVSNSGMAHGQAAGTANIVAALSAVTSSVPITVTNANATAVTVAPAVQTIAPGTQASFIATGTFDDGTTQIITTDCHWTSSDNSVATVTQYGLALSTAKPGSTQIQASFETVAGSATLNVAAITLTSIDVTPHTNVLAPLSITQYLAQGTYSDGSKQFIFNNITWTSSAKSVADVSSSGVVTGLSAGAANISATVGSVTSNLAQLLVEGSLPVSLSVTPNTAKVAAGYETQFNATGTYPDGSTQNVTAFANWTSDNPSVATVGSNSTSAGLASGISVGTANIGAAFGGQFASAVLSVTGDTLLSIAISPQNPTLSLAAAQQSFTAMGTFTNGLTLDLTTQANWTSSDIGVAVIGSSGQATLTGKGQTTIKASINGVATTTVLTVN